MGVLWIKWQTGLQAGMWLLYRLSKLMYHYCGYFHVFLPFPACLIPKFWIKCASVSNSTLVVLATVLPRVGNKCCPSPGSNCSPSWHISMHPCHSGLFPSCLNFFKGRKKEVWKKEERRKKAGWEKVWDGCECVATLVTFWNSFLIQPHPL